MFSAKFALLSVAIASVSACSNSGGNVPDARLVADAAVDAARTPDADDTLDAITPIDAGVADATPTPVTMHVALLGQPTVGRTVNYQTADGTFLGGRLTDIDGETSLIVPPGSTVTSASPLPLVNGDYFYTVEGVQPGDVLQQTTTAQANEATMTVSFGAVDGAVTYEVIIACSGNNAPSTASSSSPTGIAINVGGCGIDGDMLIVASDGQGAIVSTLYVASVAIGSDFVDDGQHGSFVAPRQVVAEVDNVDAAVGLTLVTFSLQDRFGQLMQVENSIDSTSHTKAFVIPDVPDVTWDMTTVMLRFDIAGSSQLIYENIAPTDSYTLDASGNEMSWLSGFAVDSTLQAVTWDETASPDIAPDFVLLSLVVSHGGSDFQWDIVAPYQSGLVILPLPLDGSGEPTVGAGDAVVEIFAKLGKCAGGYDAFRNNTGGPLGLLPTSQLAAGQQCVFTTQAPH